MEEIKSLSKRLEYKHYIKHNNIDYIREETMLMYPFFHIIMWRSYDEEDYQTNGVIEYYSEDHGWSDGRKCNKSNPIPEIEQIFKETIGKQLIYF